MLSKSGKLSILYFFILECLNAHLIMPNLKQNHSIIVPFATTYLTTPCDASQIFTIKKKKNLQTPHTITAQLSLNDVCRGPDSNIL